MSRADQSGPLYDRNYANISPVNVYRIVEDVMHNGSKKPRLQINAANCVHCKTCDIKDPYENIT